MVIYPPPRRGDLQLPFLAPSVFFREAAHFTELCGVRFKTDLLVMCLRTYPPPFFPRLADPPPLVQAPGLSKHHPPGFMRSFGR